MVSAQTLDQISDSTAIQFKEDNMVELERF